MPKTFFKKGFLALAVTSAMGLSSFALADVVIGVAGPHTGPNASFGEQYWRGAEQAAADINAAGGINGEKIKLVKADDACEPKQAVAVANRLVDQDKAVAVVGHFCSSSTIPASEVYDEAGVIVINQRVYSVDELEALLRRGRARNPQLAAIIRCDRRARHADFVKVLNLCERTGVRQVSVATLQSDE